MKAVIMAGGEGTRLKPLTCDLPKPMVRLCGRPIMEYILDLLAENGFNSASVTTRYLPHIIEEHFPGGTYKNMTLRFVEEDRPLGTAGSVKNVAKDFEETFLVISGDAMCDFDLQKAVAFHKEQKADATLVVKHVPDPREYGLVQIENDRVTGFVEKPCYAQAVCDTANTGIYILEPSCLEMIDDGRAFDFAKDLFPRMMEKGAKLAAYAAEGYWCDIGDLDSLRACMGDMLEGKVECDIKGRGMGGILFKETPDPGDYTLQPPCYIGENVRIGEGAVVGPYAVLDDDVTIGRGAYVEASAVYQRAHLGAGSRVIGALVAHDAFIGGKAQLQEGSAVGGGAVIGTRAVIEPSIKVWNKKFVEDDTVQHVNLQLGTGRREVFDEEGLFGRTNVEMTPDMCARIGSALGTYQKHGRIGLSYGEGGSAPILAQSISSGILSTGCDVWDFGSSFESELAYLTQNCDLDFGVHISGQEESVIRLVVQGGLGAPRSMERDIEHCLSRGEFLRAEFDGFGHYVDMANAHKLYARYCAKAAQRDFKGMLLRVESANSALKARFSEIAGLLGMEISQSADTLVNFSRDGRSCVIENDEMGVMRWEIILALAAEDLFRIGKTVAVPFETPEFIDRVAEEYKGTVARYMACPAGKEDKTARQAYLENSWLGDGIYCGLKALEALHFEPSRVQYLIEKAGNFAVVHRTFSIQDSPCAVMGKITAMTREQNGIGEGVSLPYGDGKILARPLKRGGKIKVIAQAASSEMAEELCAAFMHEVAGDDLD